MDLLNSSKLHKFPNDSIKYRQILNIHFTLISNNASELNFDIRRSNDYKYPMFANKIDRFDISKYYNRIGFFKTKLLLIHAFLKKFIERFQDQNIRSSFEIT
jgi:hypothetical protein